MSRGILLIVIITIITLKSISVSGAQDSSQDGFSFRKMFGNKSFLEPLKTVKDKTSKFLEDTGNGIKNSAGQVLDKANNVRDKANLAIDNVGKHIKDKADKIVDNVKVSASIFKNVTSEKINSTSTKIKSEAKEFMNKTGNKIKDKTEKLVDTVKESAIIIKEKLKQYIRKIGLRSIFTKQIKTAYDNFKNMFQQKSIQNATESEQRREIFEKRVENLNQHNLDYKNGLVSFAVGLTRYSDWDHKKFSFIKNGLIQYNEPEIPRILLGRSRTPNPADLPDAVDWRDKTYIPPVKEQGDMCRSCWAFAAASTIETYLSKKFDVQVSISQQNYVDCAKEDGCDGGHMIDAYEYTINRTGVNSDDSYPYMGYLGRCHFKPNLPLIAGQLVSFRRLPRGDEQALKEYVALHGPIAVGIDAGTPLMQDYIGDLFYDETCSENINHAVVIVGYGTTPEGEHYWLIKNSWGTQWGESGYLKLARNRNNHCGIANSAVYPIFD